ncbi:hypothetical protein ACSBR1_039601 [Camellia fascicularis]
MWLHRRCNFFGWLAWKGRIKTSCYLQSIGVLSDASNVSCIFCRNELETVNHLLLCCPFSWRIWSNIINWWGVSWVLSGSVSSLLQWWDGYRFNKKEKVIWKVMPLAVLWSIWRKRNEMVFNGTQVVLERLCELIKIRIALWFGASNLSFCYSSH